MATSGQLASLNATLMQMSARLSTVEAQQQTGTEELNTFYLMWAGALIFLMQAGFATLSAGSIRAKNVSNILLKNLLDACIGCVAWFLVGYGFAYDADACTSDEACAQPGAHKGNPFIGSGKTHFALSGVKDWESQHAHGYDWITFFFQYTFAAAAATIVSGAVAERCQLVAYLVYSFGITGMVYPVIAHWVWDANGFLCASNPKAILSGVIDFAGSGVVHMTGGWAALVGAKVLGPRLGRFENPAAFEGHSTPLQAVGTFLLWFGWYGFNPGSTLMLHGSSRDMARVAVTTTLSAAVGGITGLFVKRFLPNRFGGSGFYELGHTCNSLLGGLVGVTAACSVVYPSGAILIGIISAFVYHLGSCTMRKLKIDDPLDAFAVHGSCGMWGCIAVGIFCVKEYSYAPIANPDAGIFMPGTRGLLFGTQIVFVILVVLWVVTTSLCLFVPLKLAGIFRVSREQEDIGADISKHGGAAYIYPPQTSLGSPKISGAASVSPVQKYSAGNGNSGDP
jgi:Amt family ammonium transporter